MTDRTCADRLPEHMRSRADHLAGLFRIINGEATPEDFAEHDIDPASDYPEDDGGERLAELPLAIDTYRTVKVTLSTGGPADGLVFHVNSDGEAFDVRYWFADWFDYAERDVPEDSPLLDYAADIAGLIHETEQSR